MFSPSAPQVTEEEKARRVLSDEREEQIDRAEIDRGADVVGADGDDVEANIADDDLIVVVVFVNGEAQRVAAAARIALILILDFRSLSSLNSAKTSLEDEREKKKCELEKTREKKKLLAILKKML